MRERIIDVATAIRANRYTGAVATFAAGSIVRGEGTPFSDLDLVVVYAAAVRVPRVIHVRRLSSRGLRARSSHTGVLLSGGRQAERRSRAGSDGCGGNRDSCLQCRREGIVLLDGVVETDGRIADVIVVHSSAAEFDAAGVAAFKQWRFTPSALAGKPVPVVVGVQLTFNLR